MKGHIPGMPNIQNKQIHRDMKTICGRQGPEGKEKLKDLEGGT